MKILIIYGSNSDKKYFAKAIKYLKKQKLHFEEKIYSAHRDTDNLLKYLKQINSDASFKVIITVAGLSAALTGVVTGAVKIPVIGVPVPHPPFNGVDALLSMLQTPDGIPAVSVGIHKKASLNSVRFAERILNLKF